MKNYSEIVATVLSTAFESNIVAADDEERGKAQLTRLAAFEIHRFNPDIGLRKKTGGNQVADLSVDTIVDRTDGTVVDIATSRDEVKGQTKAILAGWFDYGPNPAEIATYVEPTEALAGLPGPMQATIDPGPVPGEDPDEGDGEPGEGETDPIDVIIESLDAIENRLAKIDARIDADTEAILARSDENTAKIQQQIATIVEDAEATLRQYLPILLAVLGSRGNVVGLSSLLASRSIPSADVAAEQLAALLDRLKV